MDLATFEQLVSAVGRSALAAAADLGPTLTSFPACLDRLRKSYPDDLARAALETTLLRRRARAKFPDADRMFFDRDALEMASGPAVAAHRAARFARFGTVADLGCGIGADTIELARVGCRVVAVDHDPVRLRMAEANVTALGLSATILHADMLGRDLPPADAVFADPGRRPGGKRVLSVRDYEPPVAAILDRVRPRLPGLVGVKVAPGVPATEWRAFPGEVEFISHAGELKEAVFWTDADESHRVTATVLVTDPASSNVNAHRLTDGSGATDVTPVGAYLLDPDPAVSRSGLVAVLAAKVGGTLIDPGIAVLTSETLTPTPFATAYRVDEVLPFHARRVGEWLRARGIGRVTVVKRGSSEDADALVKRWKLRGDGHREVVLTRANGSPVAVVGERVG